MDKIGIGMIGASPERGWATGAHIPALKSLPDYELRAVSTTSRKSAEETAKKFDVPFAFDNHADLIARPEVDLVVVSVKVPGHFELVTAALAAGKAVFCEWPLGNGLDEAVRMADMARAKGVHAFVGLQARASPVVNYVRDLVADGYVGRVMSTSLLGAGGGWFGGTVSRFSTYLFDKRNGATLLSIPFGHTVDALCWCLGEFESVSATMIRQLDTITVQETGETLPVTTENQVVVSGVLRGGAAASIHYRGGVVRGTNLLWEINGTEGDLVVTAGSGHAQMTELRLQGARGGDKHVQTLPIPPKYFWAPRDTPAGFPFNVAQQYVRLARDWREGTHLCPTFDDAVIRHRLLDAVERAAATGRRQILG